MYRAVVRMLGALVMAAILFGLAGCGSGRKATAVDQTRFSSAIVGVLSASSYEYTFAESQDESHHVVTVNRPDRVEEKVTSTRAQMQSDADTNVIITVGDATWDNAHYLGASPPRFDPRPSVWTDGVESADYELKAAQVSRLTQAQGNKYSFTITGTPPVTLDPVSQQLRDYVSGTVTLTPGGQLDTLTLKVREGSSLTYHYDRIGDAPSVDAPPVSEVTASDG